MSNIPPIINQPYQMPSRQPQRTSGLAVVSMLTGAMAPVTFCLICISAPLAMIAIATGHVAYSQIRRTPDTLTGGAMAIIGLVGGYLGMVLSIGFMALALVTGKSESTATTSASAKSALSEIELKIATDNKGIAHGNSDEAKEIADRFATTMKALDEVAFTQRDTKFKLSDDNYVAYCELSDDSCLLVVHVPEYRHFDDEAKDALADLAWTTAQAAVSDELEEGDRLGVALKGDFLFGVVMVGQVGDEDPRTRTKDKKDLYPFFDNQSLIKKVDSPASKPDAAREPAAEP